MKPGRKIWWHGEEDDGGSDHGRDGEEQDDLTTSDEDDPTSSDEEPAMETDDKGSYMTKGGRRQIRASLREIGEVYQMYVKLPAQMPQEVPSPPRKKARLPGAWRVMHIFMATVAFAEFAVGRGWDLWEPITKETGYDLTTHDDQTDAWNYLVRVDPDVIILTPPSGQYMKDQNTPMTVRDGRRRRKSVFEILVFAVEVFRRQVSHGRVAVCIRLPQARVWQRYPMQSLLMDPNFG